MPDLLLELFSEEIPARMQRRAAGDLKRLVTNGLVERGLTYEGGAAHFGPRRLTLDLRGLPAETPTRREERKGPRVGAPERALEGFLRSTGVAREALEARPDKKGEVWFAVVTIPGRPAAEIVAEAVTEAVRAFPWPKSMRWGGGRDEKGGDLRWVRPLHAILCLLIDEQGARAVPFEVGGVASGAETRGHRFMAPDPIRPRDFADYCAKLEAARVVVDAEARADRILHDSRALAFARGLELVEDAGLLEEVAGLVEWPVCLLGEIEPRFLDLPPEVLRASMKEHQKFFSVRNPATGRIEAFVTVANVVAPDGGETLLAGNRRVLAARLSDAKFFWENDLRVVQGRGVEGVAEMAKPLESVTFHHALGSQAHRVARIAALARELAPHVGADPDLAEQAARAAKADLASQMVYEFPELQGVMGRYYAEAAGLPPQVAAVAEAHYRPLGPSDEVPSEPVSVAVALADKLDMLTGFWAIDEKPTGSKDPFALRRAALGVVRILLELNIRLSLKKPMRNSLTRHLLPLVDIQKALGESVSSERERLEIDAAEQPETLQKAHSLYGRMKNFEEKAPERLEVGRIATACLEQVERASAELLAFFADRLKVHLRGEGVRHDVIDACFRAGAGGEALAAPALSRGLSDAAAGADGEGPGSSPGQRPVAAPQDDLVLLVRRVHALQAFLATEDGANLLTAHRRAANILAAEEKKDGVEYSLPPEPRLAEPGAEAGLFAALDEAEPALERALEAEDFAAAMSALAALRAPVDAFFDHVTVNAENQTLRRNRLCLLRRITEATARVADFSAIEG